MTLNKGINMEEVVNQEEVLVTEEPIITPQPGEKTDPALLLKSLHEEREKRRVAEAEADRLRTLQDTSQGDMSDEGKHLLSKISALETEIEQRKHAEALSTLQTEYPALKDKLADFQDYLAAHETIPMEIAAKAFLVDNNLIAQPRKGLERTTGGSRAPQSTGMTPEDIDTLRTTNYREFKRKLQAGELKV